MIKGFRRISLQLMITIHCKKSKTNCMLKIIYRTKKTFTGHF